MNRRADSGLVVVGESDNHLPGSRPSETVGIGLLGFTSDPV